MSAVTFTAGAVEPCGPDPRVRNALAGAALQGGNPVYFDSSGLAQLATSADATHAQFAGIAISRMNTGYAGGSGQAVQVVQWGEVEGFALGSVAYWAPVYLADDGTLATTAGTKTVVVGRCVPTTEFDSSGNLRKVLMVMVPFNTIIS